jgi:hypothetical protein
VFGRPRRQAALIDMEKCAKRHRETRNRCLGTCGFISPFDPLFRLLLVQLAVEGVEGLPRNWINARISHAHNPPTP